MVLESNTLDVLFVKDGQQGEDGKILYTWIKYAKDANGTGITDDPNGAIYIGISYNNESSIESNDPTHYAWTKIQGVDGKKGEDAYTIFLENENISFATDENRNPLSEQAYTSGITIMKGAKPVTDFTIGDIAKTQGIAVAKTDTAIAISVINGNPLPSDSGEIEIPITVGGTAFKKILTWTCAKKGDQGEKGEQGIQGPQGEQGIAGKDGTSVTITNKSITYQLSTSGTTIPTGTWQTTPQAIPEGQYQWTKTSVTYSDGNKTESYSISYHGKNGSDGTSVKTTSTSVKYQVGDSGTTKPTGTWQSNVPTVAQGKYLWTQTIVNYSDGNSTESYSVSYRGIDGSNGVNGMNAATIYLYQRATSTPSKPSNTLTYTFSTTTITGTLNNGWSTAIPTGTDAVYVTVASVSSKNDTATIATSAWSAPVVLAQNGKTGSDGKAGLNVATIYLYQRNTSKPSKPSASVTYTFSTGVASGLNNGWSQKIPDGTNPLYVTLATASSNTATDTILSSEWSDVVVMAQNGEDGQDGISPKVTLSKSGDTTTISIVDATGTHTQTVKDGTNGTPGAAGKDGKTSYFHVKYSNDGGKTFTGNSGEDTGIYMGSYTDYTEADSTDVSKYTWVKVKGDKGDTGQKGDNAKNLTITPSSQYFKSTDGGKTFAPNVITIKPTIQGEINFGKWQFSIDGGVSFTDVVSGQKGLTINNNVLTVSKDSSLYSDAVTMVTFRAVANDSSFYDTCSIAKIYDVSDIEIGGRNLLLNSDKEYVMGFGIPNTTWTDGYAYIGLPTTRINDEILPQNNAFLLHPEAGKTYTQTIWIETDADVIDLNAAQVSWFTGKYGHVLVAAKIIKLADNSYKLTSTHTVTKEDSDIRLFDIMFLFSALDISNSGTYLKFGKLKVEQGNVSTDWTPAIEDVQTAILSTKSEISDVSSQVDKNKQAIEQRVEKNTYQQDLNLVKGDISKANEGLNKWRYEIYPKSLFTDKTEDQSQYDIGVFIRNKNLTPSQSVLLDDASLSTGMNYGNSHIAYGLTFIKMSATKSVTTTFYNDDGASFYVNGKQIINTVANYTSGTSITFTLVQGWNCLEVVLNEGDGSEGFSFSTTLSTISECQLMNCYYGTPVARQSHITNQLVENTTNIEGVTTTMQKVMTTVGGSDRIDEFVNNYNKTIESAKQFKKTIGETYTTKDEFNGLEIGGRNLILNSAFKKGRKEWSDWGNPTTREIVSSNGKSWAHIVGNKQNYQGFNQWTPAGSIKEGDHITFSARIKGSAANQRFTVGIHWLNSGNTIISQDWHTFIVDTTENVYTWTVNASGSGCNKLNLMVGVSDPSIVYNVYFTEIMVVKGNKATDWTPATEDDEINGQNLVSNLPSNWEQGSFQDSKTNVGCDYDTNKASMTTRIRVKELVPVSGTITISNAYSNQSKKPIQHWITAFDINKKWLGASYVSTAWSDFPRIVDMKDAKYIAVIVKYKDESAITPSDISQICLKIERGTSATPFTLAPEDVNGKIVNVETIANQTAKKFEWIVKGGDKSSSMVLTDDFLNIVANKINLKGKVTFESLSSDAKNEIGKVAQSKVDGLEIGGRNLLVQKNITQGYLTTDGKGSFINSGGGDQTSDWIDVSGNKYITITLYEDFTNTNNSGRYCEYDADKNCISTIDYNPRQKSSVIIELKSNTKYIRVTAIECKTRRYKIEAGNKATDWTPAPEDYLPQVDLVSNWTTNTTWIDGGKIYTGSITADKIAANAITADKIATDAIKSRNYISSGGTQGSFLNLSDGSFTSPNLSWDSNGNLIAKNANLSGEITATKGKIGKYTITDQWLITGSGSTASGFGGNQAFWAGSSSSNDAPFRVGYNGKLYANGATISGDITATTGKIGDLTLKDGILTGTGSYSEPYTEDDDGTVTSTITTNYITKLFGKGLTIDSTVKYSDEDDVYSYKVSVLPDEISFTDGEEIGMLGAGGLRILQVNDNSDSYSSEANEVSLSSGASNFYYTTPVNQTTDKYLHVCFSADGASFMASQGDKFNSFDIGYSSAKYSGNFAANKFVYTGNSLNYVECLEANDTTNIYFHSNGYYSFRVNNEGNWSNETQSVYITERGISVPGQIGLYSQEMSNYVARYYIAGSTKSTAIGNNSYQTRIYGSSVWANKAVSTSDVRLKQDFQSLDKFEDLYMQLQPVSFKYIDGYDKSEDRYFGLKAQPTEKLFEDMGENPDDYAMFNKFGIDHEDIKERIGYDVDFDEEHGLDYTNLITLNTHMVQKTRRELAELQKENAELKDMLKTIVKKINM